ncbi:isoprenylcysteine carboxylmethyltransferase family protein [Ahrensia sp. 13_GOM-1096m]|uniref:methyltransferase family protein n=1 Tax=Ahrensia sp. 13_GOM-1096m TaxID=1380380 RepID=UPI0006864038|nr:isoprenylcysteine carboxylmethyltransferase family protein [Ahrensia sp. 13_GOM-1096m]
MMTIEIYIATLAAGLIAGAYMLGMLVLSAIYPEKRTWPPEHATKAIKFRVWLMTILIFAAAFVLGALDWNRFEWPAAIRWGIGVPLIVLGNIAVWNGVFKIGMDATSGEATGLKTDGLYRWSRNPQYVADITILLGWGVLTASLWALPVLAIGFAVLAVAPFAEEPWLEKVYGEDYRSYRLRVPRYI